MYISIYNTRPDPILKNPTRWALATMPKLGSRGKKMLMGWGGGD